MTRCSSLLFLFAVLCFTTAGLAEPPADGALLETTPFRFPEYDTVQGFPRSVTKEEYESTKADSTFVLETLAYRSGGLTVYAYAYRPTLAGERRPVIVYCRGGYVERDLRASLAPVFRRYAAAGYVVVAPMFRESAGAEGVDEVGGGDLADLMNVAPLVRQLPWANPDRVYLLGVSRGGMMVYQAVRDGFPAKAAATVGAFSDFTKLIDAHPKVYHPLVRKIWSDYEERAAEIHERRSALAWADRLKVPLLIMHGTSDSAVDPSHAIALAARLQPAGATYELHVVSGGDHTLDRVAPMRDRALLEWFGKYE